jgi:hypothetical protein
MAKQIELVVSQETSRAISDLNTVQLRTVIHPDHSCDTHCERQGDVDTVETDGTQPEQSVEARRSQAIVD